MLVIRKKLCIHLDLIKNLANKKGTILPFCLISDILKQFIRDTTNNIIVKQNILDAM